MARSPGRGPSFPVIEILFSAAAWLGALPCAATTAPPSGAGSALAGAWRDTLVVAASGLIRQAPVPGPGLVTRIDLAAEGGSGDIADLLASVAGVQVRRFGGMGAGAVPSIHGSSAAQVQLFIDGLALESTEWGAGDLARLPLARFSSAEIHRGVVPGRLGGGGGAGAINLITRSAGGGSGSGLSAGSFGDREARAHWAGGNPGGVEVLVLAHGRRIANDFAYRDHLQTFNRTDDDTTAVRRNAQWEEWGGWTSLRIPLGDLGCKAGAGVYRRDGGRPGPSGAPTPEASVSLRRLDGRLNLDWRKGLLGLEAGAVRREDVLHDDRGQVQPGFTGLTWSRSHDLSARLTWAPRLVEEPGRGPLTGVDLRAGCEGRRQDFRQWWNAEADPRRNRSTVILFAETVLTAGAGSLQVTPGWRWRRTVDDFPPVPAFYLIPEQENVRHEDQDVSPSLGVVWELRQGVLFLEGFAARTVREPSWVELFGHRGGLSGNRDLEAEDLESWGFGCSWSPADWPVSGRLGGFVSRADQTIVYEQNSPGTSRPLNAGASATRGLEAEVLGRGPWGSSWSCNLTWQRARDRSGIAPYDGKDLPYLPPLEFWLGIRRDEGDWRPSLTLITESANYRDRANTAADRAPSRTVLNLGLSRVMSGRLAGRPAEYRITAEVINLTDDDVYDVEGYPLPGRSWRAGFQCDF